MKTRMKPVGIIFSLAMMIGLTVFYSCRKEQNQASPAEANLPTQNRILLPLSLVDNDGQMKVGVAISQQFYLLNNSNQSHSRDLTLIQNAIKAHQPLIFHLLEKSNVILSVEAASQNDVERFRKMFSKESLDKAVTESVIPNQATLTNLFSLIKKRAVTVNTTLPSADPNLTFRYAVDGCYARAHKMKKMLEEKGYSCQKQFVYGDLGATTGTCCVQWSYHVAPLVKFKNSSGVVEERIIDPSLFPNGPVTALAWRNACKNRSCNSSASVSTFANTAGNVYYRSEDGEVIYDDLYENTNCVLNAYRNLKGCATFLDNFPCE